MLRLAGASHTHTELSIFAPTEVYVASRGGRLTVFFFHVYRWKVLSLPLPGGSVDGSYRFAFLPAALEATRKGQAAADQDDKVGPTSLEALHQIMRRYAVELCA